MKMKKAAALICVAGMLASLASGCSFPSDKAQKEVV